MAVQRSALIRSPALITYNGATFFGRNDLVIRHPPGWEKVNTSMYGRVDDFKKDMIIKIPLMLWGAWENLSILFPSMFMTPVPGTSVFGTSDIPLVVQARNSDRVTYANAALTRLANLYLGVDADLFAAEVEFTALLKNNANPEDSGSYFVIDTNAYSDGAFAKTNFKRVRFTGAWGSFTGFGSIIPQKGVNLSWAIDLKPLIVDGHGTVDMTVGEEGLILDAKCIPVGPTLAQLKTQSKVESAHGSLGSANSGDLVWTGASSGPVLTLKNAFMMDTGVAFGAEPLRFGETSWRTTTGFTAGVPAAIASAA